MAFVLGDLGTERSTTGRWGETQSVPDVADWATAALKPVETTRPAASYVQALTKETNTLAGYWTVPLNPRPPATIPPLNAVTVVDLTQQLQGIARRDGMPGSSEGTAGKPAETTRKQRPQASQGPR